jgi:predicted dehydrogenase
LIEKPAGHTVEEAELLAAQAGISRCKAYVALNRRHYGSTAAIMQELASVAGVRLVNVYDQEDIVAARNAGQPEAVLRTWMYANAIHIVDYLRIYCRGKVVSVEPVIKWNPVQPQFVVAKVSFSSGDIGIYQAIWNGPGPWAVTVMTHEKRCELRPLEESSVQINGSRRQELIPRSAWDTQFKPGLRSQAEEAVKAIKGQVHNLPTIEDALQTMKLVKDIYA